mmetsp:Transcript_26150/g.34366  ORF Transcript_26150/g.34366 Transcript_26150/m.34366 type:complete len:435 (+) Transcript_26150:268-1572(+)
MADIGSRSRKRRIPRRSNDLISRYWAASRIIRYWRRQKAERIVPSCSPSEKNENSHSKNQASLRYVQTNVQNQLTISKRTMEKHLSRKNRLNELCASSSTEQKTDSSTLGELPGPSLVLPLPDRFKESYDGNDGPPFTEQQLDSIDKLALTGASQGALSISTFATPRSNGQFSPNTTPRNGYNCGFKATGPGPGGTLSLAQVQAGHPVQIVFQGPSQPQSSGFVAAAPPVNGGEDLLDACGAGSVALTRRLLRKGADPNYQCEDGWTPLHLAAAAGHVDIVAILIGHCATLDGLDFAGRTPLWWACYNGHLETVRCLIQRGADRSISDEEGYFPGDKFNKKSSPDADSNRSVDSFSSEEQRSKGFNESKAGQEEDGEEGSLFATVSTARRQDILDALTQTEKRTSERSSEKNLSLIHPLNGTTANQKSSVCMIM